MSEEMTPGDAPVDLKRARRYRSRQMVDGVIDRLPPHSPECERGILGCIMLDPNESMRECLEFMKSWVGVFYDLRHQTIFDMLLQMFDERQAIDIITLQQRLRDKQLLEQVGGLMYLSDLVNHTPSAANISYYLDFVRDKYILQQMIHTCTEVVGKIYDHEGEVEELMDEVERSILSVNQSAERSRGLADIRAIQHELTNDYEAAMSQSRPVGLLSGFSALDHVAGGMMPQEMIVLAALRSAGKTALAMNIAWNVMQSGTPVGVMSLETSAKKLVHRLACAVGHCEGGRLLAGNPQNDDCPKLIGAFKRINSHRNNLLLDDSGNLSASQVAAKLRRMYQAGARLLILDYLQLVNGSGTDYERVSHVSRAIKGMAKELNCPILVISSLNRESDKENRAPRLSDLRASGQIEYDADKVYLLHCVDANTPIRDVELNVAKNKDGATDKLRLTFFAAQFRMHTPL